MNGMVNEELRNPKFVFTGEALALSKSLPIVGCHQGISSDTRTTRIVVRPPARPNQLNLVISGFMHFTSYYNGTFPMCMRSLV